MRNIVATFLRDSLTNLVFVNCAARLLATKDLLYLSCIVFSLSSPGWLCPGYRCWMWSTLMLLSCLAPAFFNNRITQEDEPEESFNAFNEAQMYWFMAPRGSWTEPNSPYNQLMSTMAINQSSKRCYTGEYHVLGNTEYKTIWLASSPDIHRSPPRFMVLLNRHKRSLMGCGRTFKKYIMRRPMPRPTSR